MKRKFVGVLGALALASGVMVAWIGPASAGETTRISEVTVTKHVVGDDPGTSFPITVTCTSSDGKGSNPNPTGSDINLSLDDQGSSTVELGDGDHSTVTVEYPRNADSVDCSVSEDPNDANLPSGWSCDASIDPSADFNVYDGKDSSDESVDVTNDCTAPPVTTTTTLAPTPKPTPAPAPVVAAAKFTG